MFRSVNPKNNKLLKTYDNLTFNQVNDKLEKAYKKDANFNKNDFLNKAKKIALKSEELKNNIQFELRQLSKNLAEDFTI